MSHPCETLEQRWSACRGEFPHVSSGLLGCMFSTLECHCSGCASVGRGLNTRWPCTSPRRNHCRNATAGLGRYITPARWSCNLPEAFAGPLQYPFATDPWRWSVPAQRYLLEAPA